MKIRARLTIVLFIVDLNGVRKPKIEDAIIHGRGQESSKRAGNK